MLAESQYVSAHAVPTSHQLDEPVVIRLCLFERGGYVSADDEETRFRLLHPIAGDLS